MPIDGSANERNTATPNGASSERVQAKLMALLDDITVTAATADTLPTAHTGDQEPSAPPPAETEKRLPPVNQEAAQVAAHIKSIQAGSAKPPNDGAAEPEAATHLGPGQVTIKGRSEGITIEIGKGHWAELVEELRERLAQSGAFFRGGSVALEVGVRPLLENELDEVRRLLEQSGLTLGVVRTGAERTFEAALSLGLAARLTSNGESDAEVELAGSNQGFARYFVFRGNLR